jgi:hypothetical protein
MKKSTYCSKTLGGLHFAELWNAYSLINVRTPWGISMMKGNSSGGLGPVTMVSKR